jgi:L-arabonate dehydrase
VSMDVEESIRANPIDGVVLLCGCDKTTPALMMGAASCDIPTIVVSGGAMLNGSFRGKRVGSGTSLFAMNADVRAGRMSRDEFRSVESCMSRSAGHCNTMGTASTMASIVEAMGIGLPGNATIPAADSRRKVLARDAGQRIVELVHDDVRMSDILTRESFENAIRVNAAIGGSTNAVVHLLALAGRTEVALCLEDFDTVARGIPLLVNLMPAGEHLMEDLFDAGGLQAVMNEMGDLLHTSALTVTGRTLGDNIADSEIWNHDVVRSRQHPISPEAGIAVLRGNLAPDGAVIKPAAATASLLQHRGRAVVFNGVEDLKRRIDDPSLEIDEDSVLVLFGAGPRGYPGMPEVGNLPVPTALLEKGIRDMVRISDARMSGTAYGTVVLHVSPEGAVGGPLSLVRTGDFIELDVAGRRLHLDVPDEELARRMAGWPSRPEVPSSGYRRLFDEHVLQAHEGADFDFLVGKRGVDVVGDNHWD